MRSRVFSSLAVAAALAVGASSAAAVEPRMPGWVGDVRSDGGPPAFVDDLVADGGPPAWLEAADLDEDGTALTASEDAEVGTAGAESANVPAWVEDVMADGGPPAWVEEVKGEGGPPAWVAGQRSSNAQIPATVQPRSGR